MTAAEVIREIQTLSPEEQAEVIRYAYRLDAERRLSGPELSALAARMVQSEDPEEVLMLRDQITRGFYGGSNHA